MSCLIQKNSQGSIIGVLAPNGQKSQLFDAIHRNIFMADPETSVKVMMNAYVPGIEQMFAGAAENVYDTGEPKVFFKATNGTEYSDLEEMIINSEPGASKMGFKNPTTGEFIQIAGFDSSASENSQFLFSEVQEGVMSAQRILDENGNTKFQGKGEYPETMLVTARMAKFNAMCDLGKGDVVVSKDGTFTFPAGNENMVVETINGELKVIRMEDVPNSLEDLDDQTKADLLIQHQQIHGNPRSVDKERPVSSTSYADLHDYLTNFLSSLGFETTTLEKYRESYNTRYGNDPDVQALADIANKVVAFQEGRIPLEDLSEEVAHIALEAWNDQNSIMTLISNVHLTPEYAEHSEYYREKYAPSYEGAQLEEHVGKEVLGKILAKQFQTNFSTRNKTAEEQNIIGKLKTIWRQITQSWKSIFKPYHRQVIDKINARIADSLLSGSMEDFQNQLNSDNFYYSAMDAQSRSIEKTLAKNKRVIEDLFTRVLNETVPRQSELNRISDIMTENNILSSVNTIAGIASDQLAVLDINVQDAVRKGDLISMKDDGRYRVLSENIMPLLNSIKDQLEGLDLADPANKSLVDSLVNQIRALNQKKLDIDPKIDKDKGQYVDKIVEVTYGKTNATPEQIELEKRKVEGNIRDLGWFGKLYGLVTHSENPLLQMLGLKVIEMGSAVVRQFKARADSDIDYIYDNNLRKYERTVIDKRNGKRTFYFDSMIDWAARDADKLTKENELLVELTGKSLEDIEKLRKRYSTSEILDAEDKIQDFGKRMKEWDQSENLERRFKPAYYEQRQKRFDQVDVAESTREYLSNVNATEYNILRPYVNEDGSVDRSRLTPAERQEIINLRKSKESVRSAYDQFGNLKEGLRRVKISELTQAEIAELPYSIDQTFTGELTVLKPGFKKDNLSESARTSLDLANLNMLYRQELQDKVKTNKPIQAFIDQIVEMEKKGEVAYDWVMSNASINLTDAYFENLGDVVGYDQMAQDYIDTIDDAQDASIKTALLNQYKEMQRARKDLLRQNRQINNPIETDVKNMMGLVQERVRKLDAEIEDTRRAIGVPAEMFSAAGVSTSSKGVNDAFEKMRVESGLSAFDFGLQHMTESKKVRVNDFAHRIARLVKGQDTYTKPAYEEFLQEAVASGLVRAGMTSDEIVDTLKDEYAKRNVASYFQRFEPAGYLDVIEGLQSGQISVSEILENKAAAIAKYPGLQYLDIVPDYSWTEDINNAEFINKNYKSGGYYSQPLLEKYWNERFTEKYGITKEDYRKLIQSEGYSEKGELSQLKPTRNVEEFEYLKRMIGMRETALENYGDTEVVNKYQLVQVSSEGFEKFSRISNLNAGSLKGAVKDVFQNRMDEKVYGEQLDDDNLMETGSDVGVKIIPKYYQSKLEDAEAITQNTLYAGLMDMKQSIIYQQRKSVERDMKALEWKITQQRFLNNGGSAKKNRILKKGEVSNYYEKVVEYVNHHLYGIQQTRHFETQIMGRDRDISRVVNKLQGFVRFSNLGFNFFVDMTSATTGVLNNLIDRIAGDYYHSSSANRANTQLTQLLGGYLLEAGKTNKKTKLNSLLEFFNIEEIDSRVKNSSFNRGLRLMEKSPYLLSKLANMPVTPKVLLAILNDTRYSDGAFRSYNEFSIYQKNQNPDIGKKGIDALWNEIKDDSLYDNIEIAEKQVKYNEKFKAKFSDPKAEFDKMHEKITAKAKQVIQSADGVLNEVDKVAAQRDMLTNLFMMHRGWFLINMTKRFKKKHFNIATGQAEEGHYLVLSKAIGAALRNIRNRGNWSEFVENLSPQEKRNAKRAAVEVGFMVFLLIMGELMLAGDDEDDTAIEDLAQLIYLRTVSEYNSSQMLGIPGSIVDVAKSPIVAVSTLESLEPTGLLKSIGQEDTEGNSKFFKRLKKATVLRRIDQYGDLQGQVNSFRHFHDNTLFNLGE